MKKDFFSHKASNYENNKNRVNNVQNIANSILKEIDFKPHMEIIDFGSGTGLLLEKIAPFVSKTTAIDLSTSMNKKLNEKKDNLKCEIEILQIDILQTKLTKKYNGIISSMTLHHVKDIEKLFIEFYDLLEDTGFIALADLDLEDGTFHTEDTGVHHLGFDRKFIKNVAKKAGFSDIKIQDSSIAHKPHGKYPIFLLTAKK